MRRFEELGKRFKEKTDGITVFPKIVSQLKHYYKRWRTNNAIGLVHDSIRLPYQLFLKSLAKLPELTGNLLTFRQSATKELAEELANLEKDNSQQELAIPLCSYCSYSKTMGSKEECKCLLLLPLL
jgi:hypothetical protein